jgi:hypothetical protein
VYNPSTRRVVSSRNVVFDDAPILSMGESNAEQRHDDEEDSIPRTMCSEERDTLLGESPPRESLQHSGSMEDERDMHSGETPRPRYNHRSSASNSNAYPVQGIISVQRALREMDGLREVPQLLSQPAARLLKRLSHTSKR